MQLNNNIMSCFISTSVSSVVGNLTTVAKDYIESKFPRNYFKEVHVTTEISSSEMKEDADDVKKKRLPILSINPIFMPSANDTLMESYPRWRRGGKRYMFRDTKSRYYPVFFDDVNDIYVWAIPNRIKVNFEMKVKVASSMRQMDLIYYIRQRMGTSGYSFLNEQRLETEIPKSIIKGMTQLTGVDTTDNDQVLEFLNYLQRYSNGYVTRKNNLSSGNPMYQFAYGSNILIHGESGSEGDKEKINMVEKESNVSFAFSFETWIPSTFILESKNEVTYDNEEEYVFDDENISFAQSFNIKPNRIRGHKSELRWEGYVTDVNKTIDTVELESLFTEKQKKVIRYLIDNSLNIDEVFEMVSFRDMKELVKDIDYTFDWDTLTLTSINPHQNYTHFVGLYADLKLLEENFKKIKE